MKNCMKTEGAYEPLRDMASDGSLRMRVSGTFLIMDKTREEDMQYAMDPSECVSMDDIVKALTINVAYQLHMEDLTGSIELGKSAELVRLDADLENTPVDDICKINVIETIIKGKTEFGPMTSRP